MCPIFSRSCSGAIFMNAAMPTRPRVAGLDRHEQRLAETAPPSSRSPASPQFGEQLVHVSSTGLINPARFRRPKALPTAARRPRRGRAGGPGTYRPSSGRPSGRRAGRVSTGSPTGRSSSTRGVSHAGRGRNDGCRTMQHALTGWTLPVLWPTIRSDDDPRRARELGAGAGAARVRRALPRPAGRTGGRGVRRGAVESGTARSTAGPGSSRAARTSADVVSAVQLRARARPAHCPFGAAGTASRASRSADDGLVVDLSEHRRASQVDPERAHRPRPRPARRCGDARPRDPAPSGWPCRAGSSSTTGDRRADARRRASAGTDAQARPDDRQPRSRATSSRPTGEFVARQRARARGPVLGAARRRRQLRRGHVVPTSARTRSGRRCLAGPMLYPARTRPRGHARAYRDVGGRRRPTSSRRS